MTLEIQVLSWDGHKNVAGLYMLFGFLPSPLDNRECIWNRDYIISTPVQNIATATPEADISLMIEFTDIVYV
jgi:hypothetical protein